jgi:prepilin signal peptidase PulO-like enzyme (type II secretory pathway)
MLQAWSRPGRGRVNPLVPAAVIVAGLLAIPLISWQAGIGIAFGAVLAYSNALILSRRVDLAAITGNVAGALLVMQLGLLVSLSVIGVATILLARLAVATAVGEAAGFGVTHLCILAAFYWTQARREPVAEVKG